MVYLDTHVLVYLYQGDFSLLSKPAIQAIETQETLLSSFALLELSYLFEIGRIKYPAMEIVQYLSHYLDLKLCTLQASTIALKAIELTWTRDPFDRLIVGNASCQDAFLVTKDRHIQEHYPQVIW